MAKNARAQLLTALNNSGVHDRGFDKHEAKAQGLSKEDMPVTGDSTWDKIKGQAKDFGDFVKREFPDVRNMADLPKEAYREYILEKVEDGVKDSSCQAYLSRLNRVEQARAEHTGTQRHDLSDLRTMSHDLADRSATYPHRAYEDPHAVIRAIDDPGFRGIAGLQYDLAARVNGIQGMTVHSFKGTEFNAATGREMGIVELNGKGKPYQNRLVDLDTYERAKAYVQAVGTVSFQENDYRDAVRVACETIGERYAGSHAFRHNAAQAVYQEWAGKVGHDAAKSLASEALGHHRAEIIDVYMR